MRKRVLRLWIWIAPLTLALWIYPVAYRTTRLLFILGIACVWAGAIFLWRQRKAVMVPILGLTAVVVIMVSLPSRPVQTDVLVDDYCARLKMFRGVRYIWGGEGLLGIDCSGLMRQGMIWGELGYGLQTLNGGPIRHALWLWWNDCSARDLGDGSGGLTRECFRANTIAEADSSRLRRGDMAVTADGVHVLAYLGNQTWIEADPTLNQVVEVTLPTDNPWFQVPVIFVRWKWLDDSLGR